MAEEKKKKKGHGSFVSEEDLKTEEEKKIPSPIEVLLLIAELLTSLNHTAEKLVEIFENAKETASKKEVASKKVETPQAPNTPKETVSTPPPTSRVAKIIKDFEPFSDVVSIDTEKSAQFVIVKFNKYVGKDVFAKVAKVSRELGGTYISKGKDTHFEIPKMTAGTATPPPSTQQPKEPRESTKLEDVKMMFPEDLETMLSFTEKDGHIVIKPRQFLGSDNFAKIASIIRGIGGDYISAGKDSHFRVEIK